MESFTHSSSAGSIFIYKYSPEDLHHICIYNLEDTRDNQMVAWKTIAVCLSLWTLQNCQRVT